MTNIDPNPVDNKKKWQVTLVILFCVAYPFLAAKAFVFESLVLKIIAGLGPPVACIFVLPYKFWVRVVVAVVYVFLMMGAFGAAPAVPCDGCG